MAHHLALPAAVMAVQFVTLQYLVMRSSMVGELGSDYLLLGRAKGLGDRTLKYRYAARNALLPSVTVAALQLGSRSRPRSSSRGCSPTRGWAASCSSL